MRCHRSFLPAAASVPKTPARQSRTRPPARCANHNRYISYNDDSSHFAPRSFTSFTMMTGLYVILSEAEESRRHTSTLTGQNESVSLLDRFLRYLRLIPIRLSYSFLASTQVFPSFKSDRKSTR